MRKYFVILALDTGGQFRGVLTGTTRYHLYEQAFERIPEYRHGFVEFFYCEPNELGGAR